jgi:hypothetical protein
MNSRFALAALLLALPVAVLAQPRHGHGWQSTPRVYLYEHADFRGGVVVLSPGEFVENLARWSFDNGRSANDRISSIRIEGDIEVTLWVHAGFHGEALRVNSDIRDLSERFRGNLGFNDQFSSVRVDFDRHHGGRHDNGRGGHDRRAGFGRDTVRFDDVDRGIRRAYQDVLERDPDERGLRHYRTMIVDRRWNESQVRDNLRRSDEFRQVASRAVNRVYRELLERVPDANGLNTYTRMIVERGWTEADVRADIMRSAEYRARLQSGAPRSYETARRRDDRGAIR